MDLFSYKSEVENEANDFNKQLVEGEYSTVIERVEKKDTKSGGEMYSIMFRINSGNYKNFCIFKNYNTVNANEQAQNIGLKDLTKLAIASGIDDQGLKDFMPENLINKLVNVYVKIGFSSYSSKDEAVIKAYKPFKKIETTNSMTGKLAQLHNVKSNVDFAKDTIPF